MLKGKLFNVGTGFIMCSNIEDVHKIITQFTGKDDRLNSKGWLLTRAPGPSEIKWSNYGIKTGMTWFKRIIWYISFCIIFFILLTPFGIVFFISQMVGAMLFNLTGNLLASLVLLIYQSAIIRACVNKMIDRERLKNRSLEIISATTKFVVIMYFYMFIVPLVGLQAWAPIIDIITNDLSNWKFEIIEGITTSGVFFTTFIIQLACLKNGADIMQFPKVIRIVIRKWKALTEKQKKHIYEAYEFRWSYEYGYSLTAFIIVLCFSVAYPLILLFGLAFFALRVIYI
jgi:hypothetical protein